MIDLPVAIHTGYMQHLSAASCMARGSLKKSRTVVPRIIRGRLSRAENLGEIRRPHSFGQFDALVVFLVKARSKGRAEVRTARKDRSMRCLLR